MFALSILEELGRELVHQQAAWSESLILHGEEACALAATESHCLNSLLLAVHRRLSTPRQNDSDVVVVELRIIQVPDAPAAAPVEQVPDNPIVTLPVHLPLVVVGAADNDQAERYLTSPN